MKGNGYQLYGEVHHPRSAWVVLNPTVEQILVIGILECVDIEAELDKKHHDVNEA